MKLGKRKFKVKETLTAQVWARLLPEELEALEKLAEMLRMGKSKAIRYCIQTVLKEAGLLS